MLSYGSLVMEVLFDQSIQLTMQPQAAPRLEVTRTAAMLMTASGKEAIIGQTHLPDISSCRSRPFMKNILMTALLTIGSSFAFAETPMQVQQRDVSKDFAYVKHGEIKFYAIGTVDRPNIGGILLYQPRNSSEQIVVSQSVLGVTALLQNEFPEGIDEQFVRSKLAELLGRFDVQNPMVIEEMLERLRKDVWTELEPALRQKLEQILEAPRSTVLGNAWQVNFVTMNEQGGFLYRVCEGTLRPFSVTAKKTITLLEGGSGGPDESRLDRAIEKKREALRQGQLLR
jgi:hypothetical protein